MLMLFDDSILGLGIPPLILLLLVIVVVAPFVLPPVKEWKGASPKEKISVSMYFLAVVVVVIYFMGYFTGR